MSVFHFDLCDLSAEDFRQLAENIRRPSGIVQSRPWEHMKALQEIEAEEYRRGVSPVFHEERAVAA